MSGSTRLTDDQITSMLEERAESPMPPDLTHIVLTSVREARLRRHGLLGRATGRTGMLLVAAALVTAGGLAVAGIAGSMPTRPMPAVVDASPTPVAVRQNWISDQSPAFTVTRDPSDTSNLYWRAVAYDRIGLNDFGLSSTKTITRPLAADLTDQLAGDLTASLAISRRTLTFTITPAGFSDTTILSPATPVSVSDGTKLLVVGRDGYFSSLERDGGTGPYTVTAAVPETGNEPGQLNTAALRTTGRDYPTEIVSLYTDVAPGSLGPNTRSLEALALESARSDAPVDIANALLDLLRSGEFRYSTDVRDLDCADVSAVECFATFRVGFCEQYAITMAVILRDLGIPTRIAMGFRPGSRDESGSIETVASFQAHAWVEVYFNDVGWVLYDPTNVGLPTVVASPSGGAPAP